MLNADAYNECYSTNCTRKCETIRRSYRQSHWNVSNGVVSAFEYVKIETSLDFEVISVSAEYFISINASVTKNWSNAMDAFAGAQFTA